MREISEKQIQYKITVGDFNLPHINWNNWTTNRGVKNLLTKFTE